MQMASGPLLLERVYLEALVNTGCPTSRGFREVGPFTMDIRRR